MSEEKLLVILGPTSTGKTDLALHLAKRFNGELVSADSRQVYKGLDIGTGKIPGSSWMLDVCDPKKQYSVANYVKDAQKVILQIIQRDKLPIVVGGTGFYIKALLEGLPGLEMPIDLKLREQLKKLTVEQLQIRLQEISLNRWKQMNNSDRQNPRRLIRAIELKGLRPNKESKIYDSIKIGLIAPRDILYKRIDERVINRIGQGMIEEARGMHKWGLSYKRMKQLGLEYGELADYLSGKYKSETELIRNLQEKIHGYAGRQITWFKKEKDILWFDVTDKKCIEKVEKEVGRWYHQSYDTKN